MNRGFDSDDVEKKLSESYFVGDIHKTGDESEESKAKKGAIVTSLRKCAVQSLSVTVPTESLVYLPPELDPGEAVAVISNYLSAFGALYHGSKKRAKRFSRKPLRKKKILVTGGGTDEAEAVVKLGLLGGASKIFLLNSRKAMTTYHVGSHKVVSLSDRPDEWLPRVSGSMDIIIDLEYPKNFHEIKAALSKNGRLVCHIGESNRYTTPGWFSNIENVVDQAALFLVSGGTVYDFKFECENDYNEVIVSTTFCKSRCEPDIECVLTFSVQKDLNFLMRLLAMRKLRPTIDKYIKMRDVAIVREDMKRHPAVGAVVCEPWRDRET